MKREKNNSTTNQNSIGEKKIYSKSDRAITLIALIVTIIVLLILAGVTINVVVGKGGVINKSKFAVNKYKKSEDEEVETIKDLENVIGNFIDVKSGE